MAAALVASAAHAEDASTERAKKLFDAGADAYDAGNYSAATQAFQQAYDLVKLPAILFSIAQAERKQWYVKSEPAVLRDAVAKYEQYLAEVPSGGRRADATTALEELKPQLARIAPPDAAGAPAPAPTEAPKTRVMVTSSVPEALVSIDGGKPTKGMAMLEDPPAGAHRAHVTAEGYYDADVELPKPIPGTLVPYEVPLREKPALLQVTGVDGAEVTIDGRVIATTPMQPTEVSPPGAHFLAVTKNGKKAFGKEVTVTHGQTLSVPVTLDSSGQRVASEVLLVSGGGVVLAGVAFAVVSLVEQSRAQRVLDDKAHGNIQGGDIQTYDDAVAARDRWKTAATITLGAGAALAATGAILWFFDKPSPPAATVGPEPRQPQPAQPKHRDMEMGAAPLLGPGILGVAAAGRF